MHEVDIAGERLYLHPERALIWPARRTAFVADCHFGKGAVFRRAGIALPSGSAAQDLERLTSLIQEQALERLVILGDFFHGRPSDNEPFRQAFTTWRQSHRQLALEVIVGNHDRHAGHGRHDWAVDWRPAGSELGPFTLAHEPVATATERYCLAGHVHPAVQLRGQGDRIRLPVFWLQPHQAILPAFGSLTGGHTIRPATGDRLFGLGDNRIIPLPCSS